MTRGVKGFTLVELVAVTLLGALVVAAAVQVLMTNQRTYMAQNAKVEGQRSTRAALSLLTGELREISPADGDLISMGRESLELRVMRKFGVTCGIDRSGTDPVLAVTPVGEPFRAMDSVTVFVEGDPTSGDDDAWIVTRVARVDGTAACAFGPAQAVGFDADDLPAGTVDALRTGAPIRSYTTYVYELVPSPEGAYLGRRSSDGEVTRLVGPLKSPGGMEFEFMDGDGRATTVSTDVRRISVTLRTHSSALDARGEVVSDSITTLVHPRN